MFKRLQAVMCNCKIAFQLEEYFTQCKSSCMYLSPIIVETVLRKLAILTDNPIDADII